jgi:hypothetical protein
VKNKTQNEDKQNKEHNTETLKDYQYRCQEKTKHRTQYRKPKRLPVQMTEKPYFFWHLYW